MSAAVQLLLVFLGGGLGASLRWIISLSTANYLSTLLVNILGSFILAWLMSLPLGTRIAYRLFLGVGVLGGFTTYSSFNLEIIRLMQEGKPLASSFYILTGLLGCLLGGFLGIMFAKS